MDKQLHLYFTDDDGRNYMLSLAYTDGEHSITLLERVASKGGGFVSIGHSIFTDDLDEYFEIVHDALEHCEFSIFLNQYTVDLDDMVDNDNKPMLKLVDDDWPQDRADD